MPRPLTLRASFWRMVRVAPADACWEWLGRLGRGGYGAFRNRVAHRVAWELSGMPTVPRGMQLDHLCRFRACVNPAHLEPVTPKENIRRGRTAEVAAQRQTNKTHCAQGHPFDEENTYMYYKSNGRVRRNCRTCNRASKSRQAVRA